mgnify:CR=1 FL=1
MSSKIKYQYTYFIKSFKIDKTLYNKYILNLLKNEKIKLKIFTKEKDVEIDSYFEKNIKNIMFKTLSYTKEQIKELENLNKKTYSKVLNMPCICFEYILEQNTQAKLGEENRAIFQNRKNRNNMF